MDGERRGDESDQKREEIKGGGEDGKKNKRCRRRQAKTRKDKTNGKTRILDLDVDFN